MAKLGREAFYSKVYGCWLGKSIGGTLGGPHEGKDGPLSLTFYDPVPTEPQFNDDLDLQLVWLHALEEHGPGVTPAELNAEWLDHIAYPFCEYGFSQLNARRGLIPPATGSYDNYFGDCMGAPIRSEIWACVAPGLPDVAAEYAWRDAVRDHWGESVWGEMFFAALESAAFLISDRDALIEIGLAAIPPECEVARAVRQVLDSHARGYDWLQARNRILAEFWQQHPTHAPQNIAFTILGWLYGKDFGDALLTAVNCGRDTDCTGATLGSILGIVGGEQSIPAKWREPIAEGIKVGWGIVNLEVPADIRELTERTIAMAERVCARHPGAPELSEGEEVEGDAEELYKRALLAARVWERKPDEIWLDREGRRTLRYLGAPVIHPLGRKRVRVGPGRELQVNVPEGFSASVTGAADGYFDVSISAPEQFGPSVRIGLQLDGASAEFALVRGPQLLVAGPVELEHEDAEPDGLDWIPWDAAGVQWDFTRLLHGQPGAVVIRTTVVSPEARTAGFILATPHRARAWLNGKLIVRKETVQPNDMPPYNLTGDGSTNQAELQAGENRLTIVLLSGGGQCACRAYFVDDKHHGLPDIYYARPQ